MKKLIFIYGIAFLFGGYATQAQTADTVNLNIIDITGSRATVFSDGMFTKISGSTPSSSFQNESVAELISGKTTAFVKSYGQGGSATISVRGTEARHNSVLWNGFNINSASLGLTDISMIPGFLTDNMSLYRGGSSPVNGNSAIGSTLLLENSPPDFKPGNQTTLNLEGGSFGNMKGSLNTKWNNHFMECRTIVFYDEAENNFSYTNFTRPNKPEVDQKNAAYTNYGTVQDFNFKIKKNQILATGIWFQDSKREVPQIMTNPAGDANQHDNTWRSYASYKLLLRKSTLSAKVAWFREFQNFNDTRYELITNYLVNNYFGEAEYRYFIKNNLIINAGVTFNEGRAEFKEYDGNKIRSTTSVFTDIRYLFHRSWQFNLNIRQEFSNLNQPPLSPSISLEGPVYKKLVSILVKGGRNYSLPSMNDLYWIPGGNPELEPENGWSEEISLLFFNHHKFLPLITVTGYNMVIDNWIKWQPSAGGMYSPDNLRQVHSRGIESSLSYNKKINKWNFGLNLQYALCRSSISEVNHADENSTLDKQLMYVPEQMFNSDIMVSWNTCSIHFYDSYVGKRYTSSDNSNWLPGYNVANLSVEKNFFSNSTPLQIYMKINNLFDTTYQVMAYRPMPGRWYSAGIKVNFSIHTKTSKS